MTHVRAVAFGAVGLLFAVGLLGGIVGCERSSPTASPTPATFNESHAWPDSATLAKADIRILFIGNSHTMFHNVPDLVGKMIRAAKPGKTVATHVVGVGHLSDASTNPQIKAEIEQRPWTHIVLQGQAISMSGKHRYSTKDGIDLARLGRGKGADVRFFAEWARKGEADERERTETIYTEMAKESDASVIPVGRAWDAALAKRPEMALHAADGNHESQLGAFLTACVLAARLADVSPTEFAAIEFASLSAADRQFLAEIAGQIK